MPPHQVAITRERRTGAPTEQLFLRFLPAGEIAGGTLESGLIVVHRWQFIGQTAYARKAKCVGESLTWVLESRACARQRFHPQKKAAGNCFPAALKYRCLITEWRGRTLLGRLG